MSYTLTHQTTVSIQLVIHDQSGVLTLSISFITHLLWLLWQAGHWLAVGWSEVAGLVRDTWTALDFTWTVLGIGFIALAYGLGIGGRGR